MRILITGCAGFIGMHCTQRMLLNDNKVFGIDNFTANTAEELRLKQARFKVLKQHGLVDWEILDLAGAGEVDRVFNLFRPEYVLHLAAQTGVRSLYSEPYIRSNLVGFANIIEMCKKYRVKHLVYASSSSVYGVGKKISLETDRTDSPLNVYAATKKANELLAYTYSNLYMLPTTGLRYFTVYGPWGRPDMAPTIFAHSIVRGNSLPLFNNGFMSRDFTYIDDAVEATIRVLEKPPKEIPAWRVLNVGCSSPEMLLNLVKFLEQSLGKQAICREFPLQPGEIIATNANTEALKDLIECAPGTSLSVGIKHFVAWYKEYYTPVK